MAKYGKDILKKHIELVQYVTFRMNEDHEGISHLYQDLTAIQKSEYENPRLVQTRFLINDIREWVDGYPQSWKRELFQEVEDKFGKIGSEFALGLKMLK